MNLELEIALALAQHGLVKSPRPRIRGRELTYNDVRDERIEVAAQNSLVRLSKKTPGERQAATEMLAAVKSGQLAGILQENQAVPAKRARSVGGNWWEITRGKDAIMQEDPYGMEEPILVFTRIAANDADKGRLDRALVSAWSKQKNTPNSCVSRLAGGVVLASVKTPSLMAVWAENIDAPGKPCADARLNGSGSKARYPGGTSKGQAGWDMGINFSTFDDLTRQLQSNGTPAHTCGNILFDCDPIKPGQILRLAIVVHGAPGVLAVNGARGVHMTAAELRKGTFDASLASIARQLGGICTDTGDGAVILFMGCSAGKGTPGTELLIELSKRLQGHRVVAFTKVMTHGFRRLRPGKGCTEAGYRDTDFNNECPKDARTTECEMERYGTDWENLERLPWGSEISPHAKVVQDGVVLKTGGE